jgi:5'-nucleotidase
MLAPSTLFAGNRKDREDRLVILHTNDWHSRIEPFPENAGKYAGLGGAANRAALIQEFRNRYPHVLLLDSGDVFQGTPYFNYFHGAIEFQLMSQMGYDVITLGNHDFDAGLEGLVKQLDHAQFDIVNANYQFENSVLKHRVKPYQIIQKGKFKIGVFGVGIELKNLVPEHLYKGTQYVDPVEVANEISTELKHQKCNLIICLSHLGYAYSSGKVSDEDLAKKCSNIDLILGGHTHTFLDKPTQYVNKQGDKVLVNQVGWAGINLGRIDYSINMLEQVKSTSASMIKI